MPGGNRRRAWALVAVPVLMLGALLGMGLSASWATNMAQSPSHPGSAIDRPRETPTLIGAHARDQLEQAVNNNRPDKLRPAILLAASAAAAFAAALLLLVWFIRRVGRRFTPVFARAGWLARRGPPVVA